MKLVGRRFSRRRGHRAPKEGFRKSNLVVGMAVLAASAPSLGSTARRDDQVPLEYSLEGWAVSHESATGEGTITCDNGQTVPVVLRAKGGGLTAGRVSIDAESA